MSNNHHADRLAGLKLELAERIKAYVEGESGRRELYRWSMENMARIEVFSLGHYGCDTRLLRSISFDLVLLNDPEWQRATEGLFRYYIDCLLGRKKFNRREVYRLSKKPTGAGGPEGQRRAGPARR